MHLVWYCLLVLSTVAEAPCWWPSFTLLLGSFLRSGAGEDGTNSVASGLLFCLVFRSSIVVATFVHEWVHILAAMTCDSNAALRSANWRCNVPLSVWAWTVIPLVPWHEKALSPHVELPQLTHSKALVNRLFGAAVSIALALVTSMATMRYDKPSPVTDGLVLGSWTVAAGAFVSDVLQIQHSEGIFRCGNFGMLIVNSAKKSSVNFVKTLQRMVAITSARGAQSGGLVTLAEDGTAYRCRFVPTKRQDLSVNLMFWFSVGLRIHNLLSWLWRLCRCCMAVTMSHSASEAESNKKRLRSECRLFAGHTRFATSSAPTVMESHPHRFADPRIERVWRRDPQGQWRATLETTQIFVTHNGDFDFWTLFGRLRTHSDVGVWLRAVMQVGNKTACGDSTKISGLIQYLRTQGMWFPSFRLAFQNVVQPPFENYFSGAETLPIRELQRMATLADNLFEEFVNTQPQPLQTRESVMRFCVLLANKIVGLGGTVAARCGDCMGLAQEATSSFLGNDLFTALKFFLENAHGSFGLAVCSTLDPNVVVLASRGQPMSLAIDEEQGVVLWGSEASAQQVFLGPEEAAAEDDAELSPHPWDDRLQRSTKPRPNRCHFRHDLDESGGEVVELMVTSDEMDRHWALRAGLDDTGTFEGTRFVPFEQQPTLLMRVFHGQGETFASRESFLHGPSLVALVDNPHVEPLPMHVLGPKRVAADIQSITTVLSRIRMEWDDATSLSCRTAAALFDALHRKASAVSSQQCGRLEIDVLVMGVEASLWLGEQFASELQGMFPKLRVVPLSANKICGVFSNHQGADAMTGFAFSSQTMALKNAVVIAISHSGQTFPTMHATHTLRKICGDKVFVVAGAIDSKMSAAVGQMAHSSAPWACRVIPTFAGWRPSEALTVTTVACHHVLTELLLFLGVKANESEAFKRMAGVLMSVPDIGEIQRLNHNFVTCTAPETLGASLKGRPEPTPISKALQHQGRQWALHVLEGPLAWCATAIYVLGTVVASSPPFLSIKIAVWGVGSGDDDATEAELVAYRLSFVALVLDSVVYIFCPLIFSLLLRIVQGRQLFARLGKRTLVVGDVPYVHQLVESYVSKLFSLSYSIASIEVHGANPIDHLVHRFTHRVARGVLVAVGRPDGRLFSQTKAENWILLALQQCKAIVHLGAPPEIVSVGHNPYHKPSVLENTLVLSQARPNFICEAIPAVSEDKDTEPMKMMATFKHSFENGSLAIDTTEPKELQPIGSYLLENCNLQTKLHYSLLQQMSAAAVDASNHGLRDVSSHSFFNAAGIGAGPGQPARELSSPGSLRTQSRDVSWHRSSPWQQRERVDLLEAHGRIPTLGTPLEVSAHGGTGALGRSADATTHSGRGLRPTINPKDLELALAVAAGQPQSADVSARSGRRGGMRMWGSGSTRLDESSMRLLDSVVSATQDSNLERAMARSAHSLKDMLNHCTALETWYENRYASLERYMSMLVMFHAMADRVAAFPLLKFDTSRSQSQADHWQLRVATTAAPIGASDIQPEWAEGPHRVLQRVADNTSQLQPEVGMALREPAALEVRVSENDSEEP